MVGYPFIVSIIDSRRGMESINRQYTELEMLYQMSWIDAHICSDVRGHYYEVLISLCATSFQWGWHLENSQANPEQVRFCWLRKLLLKPIYGKAPGHAKKMNSFAGNTRHCPIMSISFIISLWYLWEFKWPSIFFKRPSQYLEKQP